MTLSDEMLKYGRFLLTLDRKSLDAEGEKRGLAPDPTISSDMLIKRIVDKARISILIEDENAEG